MTKRKPKSEWRRCHPHCKPGRHVFTRDECQDGFWAAIDSIVERYPDALDSAGQHMALKFLKKRNPLFFEARKLRKRVCKMQAHNQQDASALRQLKAGVRKLERKARSATQRKGHKAR